MDIYFVRHGETDWNALGKMQGQTDIPLNQKGIEQAHAKKPYVEALVFDEAYASPLRRAMHTAEIMLGEKRHIVKHDQRLGERNYGIFEGKNYLEFEEISRAHASFVPENGESREHLIKRVMEFIKEIYEKDHNRSIILFSHGGVYRALLTGLFDMTWEEYRNYRIHNCDVKHLRISRGQAQLLQDGKVILEKPFTHP